VLKVIATAIEELCAAFERGGYNPTPIIDIGVLVASADGKVDTREREMLLDVFQTLLGTSLTPEVVDHLVTASLEVIEAAGAQARARVVAQILDDCDAVDAGVRVALAIAFASQGLNDAEQTVIKRIADAGGMTPARLAQLTKDVRVHADPDPVSVRMSIAPISQRGPAS
jgi:tellurite resistance protein